MNARDPHAKATPPAAGYISSLVRSLESEYSLRQRHPEREGVYADYKQRSEAFRARHVGWHTIPYDSSERCAIDWFPARKTQAATPLFIFIHGGYWRALDRSIFSFVAEHFVQAGISTALIGYELAPKVRLGQIVEQVQQAVVQLFSQADELRFCRNSVTVAGHSAGAHLAVMASAMPPDRLGGHALRGTIPISGLFSLEPLLLTSINHDLRMTPDEAMQYSPSLIDRFYSRRFLTAVGELETNAFIDQSREFAGQMDAAGAPSALLIAPGRTHFDIVDDLATPGRPLFEQALAIAQGAGSGQEAPAINNARSIN
ncbi:MAG TPA: alpha/beta hydrolase [Ramlibacter sp.]|nr:alpha/beta hydrolase [Ramlibacter sp.]